MKSRLHGLLAVSAAVFVAACGGGGGTGVAPAALPPMAPVAITSNNQTAVAQAAFGSGLALMRSQPFEADMRATAQSSPTAAARSRSAAVEAVTLRAMQHLVAPPRSIQSAPARALAVDPDIENCGLSGNITMSVDDRNNDNSPSAGDVLTIAFNQCKDSADDLITGSVAFTLAAFSGTSSSAQLSGDFAFRQVAVTLGAVTTNISGGAAVSAVVTSSSIQITLTAAAQGMTVDESFNGHSDAVVYESGMRIGITDSLVPPFVMTVTLNGPAASTAVGGLVTLSTVQPLRQLGADTYPSSGQILATGASGSQLRITVLDKTQVRLELDANGDGTFEDTKVVAWSSLLPR